VQIARRTGSQRKQGKTATEVAEEKPALREMASKKNQEEKTLPHGQLS
jgi:hypothetical protein